MEWLTVLWAGFLFVIHTCTDCSTFKQEAALEKAERPQRKVGWHTDLWKQSGHQKAKKNLWAFVEKALWPLNREVAKQWHQLQLRNATNSLPDTVKSDPVRPKQGQWVWGVTIMAHHTVGRFTRKRVSEKRQGTLEWKFSGHLWIRHSFLLRLMQTHTSSCKSDCVLYLHYLKWRACVYELFSTPCHIGHFSESHHFLNPPCSWLASSDSFLIFSSWFPGNHHHCTPCNHHSLYRRKQPCLLFHEDKTALFR